MTGRTAHTAGELTPDEQRRNSLGSYDDGRAAQRLELLIAQAIDSYTVQAGRRPSRWIAAELIRRHPDILDAVRAG